MGRGKCSQAAASTAEASASACAATSLAATAKGACLRSARGLIDRRGRRLRRGRSALRRKHSKLDSEKRRERRTMRFELIGDPGKRLIERPHRSANGADQVDVEFGGIAQAQAQRLCRQRLPGAERLAFPFNG